MNMDDILLGKQEVDVEFERIVRKREFRHQDKEESYDEYP